MEGHAKRGESRSRKMHNAEDKEKYFQQNNAEIFYVMHEKR